MDHAFQESGNPRDIVAGMFVERKDMHWLCPEESGPVRDNVIDEWRQNVFLHRKVTPGSLVSRVIPSTFYPRLMRGYRGYNYENVRVMTKNFDIFAYDRLFLPLFVQVQIDDGGRWRLNSPRDAARLAFAMVDLKERSLAYYDAYGVSLVTNEEVGEAILTNLRRWLCDAHFDKHGVRIDESAWSIVPCPSDSPNLRMGDCRNDGIFVIKAIECLARGEPPTLTEEMMPDMRRRIALELLTGTLIADSTDTVGGIRTAPRVIPAARNVPRVLPVNALRWGESRGAWRVPFAEGE